eukprot:scaffold59875_cov22-Tisochrysis_lutea.AAC.3
MRVRWSFSWGMRQELKYCRRGNDVFSCLQFRHSQCSPKNVERYKVQCAIQRFTLITLIPVHEVLSRWGWGLVAEWCRPCVFLHWCKAAERRVVRLELRCFVLMGSMFALRCVSWSFWVALKGVKGEALLKLTRLMVVCSMKRQASRQGGQACSLPPPLAFLDMN